MRKKYIGIFLVGILLVFSAGGLIYEFYHVKEKEAVDLKEITSKQVLDRGGEYYVYFQRKECPYCNNVKEDIIKLSKKKRVYMVNTVKQGNENLKDYDWDLHQKKYNILIGEMKKGKPIFNGNLTVENIQKKYSPLKYTIQIRVDEKDKSKEKIYAVLEEPVIDIANISSGNLVIPAVPYLIYVNDGSVIEDYFGDTQILHFLKSRKKPLDDYMQIE